jgi:hypothetical protein
MAKDRNRGGRPAGAATVPRSQVVSLPPSCPTCGSTNRAPYKDGVDLERRISGEIRGQAYNRVIWRRTHCLDCPQHYTVREFHFDPPAADPVDEKPAE